MIRKSLVLCVFLLVCSTVVFAANPVLKQADDLYWGDKYEEAESATACRLGHRNRCHPESRDPLVVCRVSPWVLGTS